MNRIIAVTLRSMALIVAFFSVWFCIVGVGFIGIEIARYMFEKADELCGEMSHNNVYYY